MRQTARSISGNSERPKLPRTGSSGVGMDSSSRHVSQPYEPQQPQRPTGRRSTLMGEKLNDISNMITGNAPQSELPLYKDKPYGHSTVPRYTPTSSRTRLALPILAALVFIFYISGGTSLLYPRELKKDPETVFKKRPVTNSFNDMLSDPSIPTERWEDRRERVKDAFKVSWQAYEDNAWGFDEYHPVSRTSRQMVPNGMGWIIIDALDTMMIMNLTSQLAHAREWLSTTLSYEQNHEVSTFEATIRQLGGLLGAHYLSTTYPNMAPVPDLPNPQKNEDLYLELATDLADRLLGAYSSPSGIPFAVFNLQSRTGVMGNPADGGSGSTAEAATLQLEMKYLAKLTGEKNYWDAAEKVMKVIDDNGMRDGLVPIFLNGQTGQFQGENIRLGSRGDSYYEYLIKQYLQTKETIYHDMWKQALEGIKKHLITYTKIANLTILGERPSGLNQPIFPKMDHLVCYMPGTIALAATGGKTLKEAKKSKSWGKQQDEEMEIAKELAKTCWGMYLTTATGLSPEIAHFRTHNPPIMREDVYPKLPKSPETLRMSGDTLWRMDYDIHFADFHNMQRPEFVESLFYLWRITGDITYREWGWKIFKAFVEYTSVPNNGGFSSVQHVDKLVPPTRDNMESFWMAETLKYLYLLFSDDGLIPLESIVLNTEAHPLPRFDPGKLFHTGWERKPRGPDGNLIVS